MVQIRDPLPSLFGFSPNIKLYPKIFAGNPNEIAILARQFGYRVLALVQTRQFGYFKEYNEEDNGPYLYGACYNYSISGAVLQPVQHQR